MQQSAKKKCSGLQYSEVQCSEVQCSEVQCNGVQDSFLQCSAVQCSFDVIVLRYSLFALDAAKVGIITS